MRLTTKIVLGLVAGIVVGVIAQSTGGPVRSVVLALEPLGTGFIRLISMVVVPLVVASLFVGVCSLGDLRLLGRIGGKSLMFFLITTGLAAGLGMTIALAFEPGATVDPAIRDAIAADFSEAGETSATRAESISIRDRLIEIIPRNPVRAAVDMNLLQLIFFTLVFGAASSTLPVEKRQVLLRFFDGVNAALGVIIDGVMRLAPYGVFILIASALTRFGVELLRGLLAYSILNITGVLVFALVVLMTALKVAGVEVRAFWRHVAAAPLLAFSTASSNAALPVSLEVAEKNLGVSNQVASFVLPVGATLNMPGAAFYKALTAVFLAQVYGLSLGGPEYLTIVLTSVLAALAGVGVPGSSLVTTLIVLAAIGMGPQAATGIALVAGVDRFLDMFRSAVNVVGDLTAAAIVAKSEGEAIRA